MSLEQALRAALAAERSRCLGEHRDFDVADAMAAIWPLLEGPRSCEEAEPCEVREGLSMQLTRAQETNARLNRRVQAAESAALQNVKACVSSGLSFGRSLANWYAMRLADELQLCLALTEPPQSDRTKALAFLEVHRRRILHALPEEGAMMRWRNKQTQAKASARDGEITGGDVQCEVCNGPCMGH